MYVSIILPSKHQEGARAERPSGYETARKTKGRRGGRAIYGVLCLFLMLKIGCFRVDDDVEGSVVGEFLL
jgi:hypothetical protein